MKAKRSLIQFCLLGAVLLALSARVQAQFIFVTNNNEITITGYTGFPVTLDIPSTTNGYPVTSIANQAFFGKGTPNIVIPDSITSIGYAAFESSINVTNVVIGSGVTNIGGGAFYSCGHLATISVDTANPAYCSVDNVLFDKNQTLLIFCPQRKFGSYTIPNSVGSIEMDAFQGCALSNIAIGDGVTNIRSYAFYVCGVSSITFGSNLVSIADNAFNFCRGLTQITLPKNITSLGIDAFKDCGNLTNVFFLGNVPANVGSSVFTYDYYTTVYYLSGTTGWSNTFHGRPAVLWNPQAQNDGSLGLHTNQFGFNIVGSKNLVIVVEACTNFISPIWSPVSTNTLNTFIGTNGTSYFSDPQWTNYPGRFYRFRSP